MVDLPVDNLKPHSLHAEFFIPWTHQEVEDLASQLSNDGQLEPIEVTPDNIIISGTCRWLAAKFLGWQTIRCWLREDLAAAGPAAVEARFIEANLRRRHLTNLL